MKRTGLIALVATLLALNPLVSGEKNAGNKPPPGFTSLFDGSDLSAWKNAAKQKAWKVADGTIHYTGEGGAKNLISAKDYKDFEFVCDWKITKSGDSGIYLRGTPQVQIWDSQNLAPNLKADAGKGSGGLWNNDEGKPGKQPLVNADNPVGEWNTFHIRMVGKNVTVKLNGKTVVDDAPLKNAPTSGPIELQVHGTPLWFRNVAVRELDSAGK